MLGRLAKQKPSILVYVYDYMTQYYVGYLK